MSGMLVPDQVRRCPRCFALILDQETDWAKHMAWHRVVRDGFHEFEDNGFGNCRGVPNRPHWVGTEHCNEPAGHWFHQPLPDTAQA